MVMVVDPAGEAIAELLNEWERYFLKSPARGFRREGDVEDDDPTLELMRAG
jgi:hypothetical protein